MVSPDVDRIEAIALAAGGHAGILAGETLVLVREVRRLWRLLQDVLAAPGVEDCIHGHDGDLENNLMLRILAMEKERDDAVGATAPPPAGRLYGMQRLAKDGSTVRDELRGQGPR